MKTRWFRLAAVLIGLVAAGNPALPFPLSADQFRPALEDQLSAALGRKVNLGRLRLSVLSGDLVAEQITIADDPRFSTAPFLGAKTVHIGVNLAPLILQRLIQVRSLTIEDPSINLLHGANGEWNFSSIGPGRVRQRARSSRRGRRSSSPCPSAPPDTQAGPPVISRCDHGP